jgi:cardiolipin synthase A/B
MPYPWFLMLLAAIGVIAIVGVTLGLFSNIGETPRDGSLGGTCRVDSKDFLLALSGTTNAPILEGGSARLLNNGDAFFPAMYEAMSSAGRSINFTVYIWEPGEVSTRIFDILVERARAGVEVRVLADGLGGRKAPDDRIRELREAGGRWVRFHPPKFGQWTRFHRRNHRRAIVVDGAIGFTGGAAVADKWLGDAQDPEHWRDTMVEVRGPLARNLQSAFVQLWSHTTAELLAGAAFFPPEPGNVRDSLAGDGKEGLELCRHMGFLSAPGVTDHPLRRVFWLTFRSAERCIYVTNPYFVPDDMAREVLKERARAGVDVRILVPNEHIDLPFIRWASHSYYEELLETGIRIYEYQPTMIHHKHAVVDGIWSVVGSANMDVRSKELNQENVLGIVDKEFARSVEETFFRDLERSAEIHLDGFRRRPWWHHVPERFSRLFEEQF